MAATMPSTGVAGFRWYDRLAVLLVSAAIGWVLVRFARVRLMPAEHCLVVQNFLLSRTLDWAEVVNVRFGGGGPWVVLDLADGDTLAVMAVQRSDGAYAEAEARRLATLVALHSRTTQDD